MPGAKLLSIIKKIRQGQITVNGYNNILIHAGVCDVLNILNSKNNFVNSTPVHVILCRYLDLVLKIREFNDTAIIQLSGIIPVFRQHELTKYYIMGINNGIRILTSKLPSCVYLDTPSLFCKNFDPESRFFYDGLHLTHVAKAILGGRIRQSFNKSQVDLYYKSKLYRYLRDEYPINIFNWYSFIPSVYLD